MRFQRFFLAAMTATTLTACGADTPAPVTAPATVARAADDDAPERFHHTSRMPVVFSEWVPCANGGAGEYVTAEGVIMDRGSQHQDGSGQLHYRASSTLQGFSGVGETTGDRFSVAGGWTIRERIVPGEGDDYVDYRTFRYHFQMVGGGVKVVTHLLLRETYGEGTTPTYETVVERMSCE